MTEAGGFLVTGEDAGVTAWLRDWLAALEVRPPAELTVAVAVRDAVDEPDSRTPFLQPLVEIRSGPPLDDVRIRWRAGGASARIAGRRATVELTGSALDDRERLTQTFFTAVLVFLLRRAGWHHVHAAAARDPRGRDWLFAGNANAGKSTTAALLARYRWSVGADDLTFLARTGDAVDAVAPRVPIALRPGGQALLALAGGAAARGGRKAAWYPEELGGGRATRVTPTIVVLPRVEGGLTRIEPIRPRELLAELVRWSAWVALEPDLAQEHLDLLGALARQARGYRLALGPDLFAGRDLLMELVP